MVEAGRHVFVNAETVPIGVLLLRVQDGEAVRELDLPNEQARLGL